MKASRFSKLLIVIRPPADNPLSFPQLDKLELAIHNWAVVFFPAYDCCFTIRHYEEVPHIHGVICAPSKCRHTLKAYLNSLADFLFAVEPSRNWNTAILQVEECFHENKSIRYLMHLDDEDKTLYPLDDISSSGPLASVYLQSAMCEAPILTFGDLLAVCRDCMFQTPAIIGVIGMKNYLKYRLIIRDLKQER